MSAIPLSKIAVVVDAGLCGAVFVAVGPGLLGAGAGAAPVGFGSGAVAVGTP